MIGENDGGQAVPNAESLAPALAQLRQGASVLIFSYVGQSTPGGSPRYPSIRNRFPDHPRSRERVFLIEPRLPSFDPRARPAIAYQLQSSPPWPSKHANGRLRRRRQP